ncbi:hypothetical protein [Vibrio mimicus]|uniref:hypothetical protein n=1 Tax=Vibrio mimicus TaxID=674 RepID=UPI00022892EB|nr:hypothetical protein [Vibrio mimicus]EGU18358.1 hypothetical protein SX4_0819 [Vibrio mimicus SX-4]
MVFVLGFCLVVHKAEYTDGKLPLCLLAGECAQLYRCCAVLANDTTTLVSLFEQ